MINRDGLIRANKVCTFQVKRLVSAGWNILWTAKFIIILILAAATLDLVISAWLLGKIFSFRPDYKMDFTGWLILNLVLITLAIVFMNGLKRPELWLAGFGQLNALNLPGTAAWLPWYKIRRIFARSYKARGIIFGCHAGRPVILTDQSASNKNVIVLGPPGAMKSRAYIRNNMLQAINNRWSLIITDPKGELSRDFAALLQEKGYVVRVFNLVDPSQSDRWNPLTEVNREFDAQIVAETIIKNTRSESSSGDPFWERAEQNLLKALLLLTSNSRSATAARPDKMAQAEVFSGVQAEKFSSRPSAATFENIYKILCSGSLEKIDSHFKALPARHPALSPYQLFKTTSSQVQCSIVNGLGIRLQLFQIPELCRITSDCDIDLCLPGEQLCAYFCVIPDTDATFHLLSALFVTFALNGLIRTADQSGGSLKVPVSFLMDEFCNIGGIPDFVVKLSTIRSRNIFCSIIVQSLVQLIQMYDRCFEIVLAQCDSWLILGVNDFTSAEYLSNSIGYTYRKARTYGKKPFDFTDRGTVSDRHEARLLLNPDEMRRLSADTAVLVIRGHNPLKIKKLDYTGHPQAGLLALSTGIASPGRAIIRQDEANSEQALETTDEAGGSIIQSIQPVQTVGGEPSIMIRASSEKAQRPCRQE